MVITEKTSVGLLRGLLLNFLFRHSQKLLWKLLKRKFFHEPYKKTSAEAFLENSVENLLKTAVIISTKTFVQTLVPTSERASEECTVKTT